MEDETYIVVGPVLGRSSSTRVVVPYQHFPNKIYRNEILSKIRRSLTDGTMMGLDILQTRTSPSPSLGVPSPFSPRTEYPISVTILCVILIGVSTLTIISEDRLYQLDSGWIWFRLEFGHSSDSQNLTIAFS
jgi:hypothetical protein